MKSSLPFITVSILLGGSLLANVALLTRSRETPAPRRAAPAAPAAPAAETPEPRGTPAPVTVESRAPRPDVVAVPPAGRRAGAARIPSTIFDPSVEAIIEAQQKYDVFVKDLEPVYKARDRLEEARYFQTIVGATQNFLELAEPSRTQFGYATRAGIDEMARARKDRDDARKLLPPRDKNNAAANALYEQQKNAIDARYDERVRAAVGTVAALLDTARPLHTEFKAHADRWMRYLVPRQAQP